jgi:hypothetical protein
MTTNPHAALLREFLDEAAHPTQSGPLPRWSAWRLSRVGSTVAVGVSLSVTGCGQECAQEPAHSAAPAQAAPASVEVAEPAADDASEADQSVAGAEAPAEEEAATQPAVAEPADQAAGGTPVESMFGADVPVQSGGVRYGIPI